MENPHVSIVLVNYNSEDDTIDCVRSLQHITYNNYTIYVVDNASSNIEKLVKECPVGIRLIALSENQGFSAGNNVAIKEAIANGTDYILLLNNDTVVSNDFLTPLLDLAQKEPKAGIITGKILYYSEPHNIWFAGGSISFETGRITHRLYNKPKEQALMDKRNKITFATGCLMLIPTRVIKEVGMLSEDYFLYGEDADYCCRVTASGYDLWYEPQSEILHKVGASSKGRSFISQYYSTRNDYYVFEKYCPEDIKATAKRQLLKLRVKEVLKGIISVRAFAKGTYDYLRGIKGKVVL